MLPEMMGISETCVNCWAVLGLHGKGAAWVASVRSPEGVLCQTRASFRQLKKGSATGQS